MNNMYVYNRTSGFIHDMVPVHSRLLIMIIAGDSCKAFIILGSWLVVQWFEPKTVLNIHPKKKLVKLLKLFLMPHKNVETT